MAPIAARDAVSTLAWYDALAVPSHWLESGPLVVYEAFAAGIPVIGSRLGGIAELVRDGLDGVLVQPGSQEAWADALQRLAKTPGLIERLRAGVARPRTMADVAGEMNGIYRVAAGARVCQ